MPSIGYLGITSRCNCACKHCYVEATRKDWALPCSKAISVVDELFEIGVIKLFYTHGEVFLHEDWLTILDHASSLGFVQNVLSNGTLMTSETCQNLSRVGCQKVYLSIDSSDSTVHSNSRNRPDAWGCLKRGVALLKDTTSIRVGLNTVLTLRAARELTDMFDIAESWGADEFNVLTLHPQDAGEMPANEICLAALSGLLHHAVGRQCAVSFHDPYMTAMLRLQGHVLQNDICGAGSDYISIHADGDVFPCNFLPVSLGNVHHMTLSDIAQRGQRFREQCERERQTSCNIRGCDRYASCMGGCLAFGYSETGAGCDMRCDRMTDDSQGERRLR